MKTSLIVTATDSLGKTKQKTISDINPNATNEQIVALTSAMINTLTNSTYNGTSRIDKIDCDTEVSKQTPTLTLSKSSVSISSDEDFRTASQYRRMNDYLVATYNGDGEFIFPTNYMPNGLSLTNFERINEGFKFLFAWDTDVGTLAAPVTIPISITEGTQYKAISANFVINP